MNKFDLSHERKMSMRMGWNVPIMCQDILPGDRFRVSSEIFVRFAPLLAPIMHRVNVTTHFFFVPNRLVWDEWEEFITGGRLGTSNPVAPFMTSNTIRSTGLGAASSLADYLGLPIMDGAVFVEPINISALPFRAYQLIFDEYYRDQNLQIPVEIAKTSGEVFFTEAVKLLTLRNRAWEKDYFTSALPWSQRGGDVSVPIAGTADVIYKDISEVFDSSGAPPSASGDLNVLIGDEQLRIPGPTVGRIENIDAVDLDSATGVSINELRRSVRLQEWLEKNAVGGARYIEQIKAHFNVTSSDARLQRPEYLGGGRNPVVISEVVSTFQESGGTGEPQGNMAGHAVSMGRTNGFSRRFEEHGYVIGIMSVLPKTAYQQGVPRHFTRFDKLDYPWPEFAQIGEQEVKMKELYYDGTVTNTPEVTFGYQSRYAECKYGCSTVHGEFRTTQNFWHMGRIFPGQPGLNETFVTSDPTSRIFPVSDGADQLYVQLYNRVDAVRPLPYFGTPTL